MLRVVERFLDHGDRVRLHSAWGYLAPRDFLAGRQQQILDEHDRRIEAARRQRASRRALLRTAASAPPIQAHGGPFHPCPSLLFLPLRPGLSA